MRKTVLLILMLSLVKHSFCQVEADEKIDSLLKVLKTAKEDTAKVNALNALAYEFRNSDPDTAIYFSNEGLKLATKANYAIGQGEGYLWKGSALLNRGDYAGALENSSEALRICDQALSSANATEKSKILYQKAWAFTNTGLSYWYQGDYAEALKNHLTALKIREELLDKKGIGESYNNIGNVYFKQSDYVQALNNYFLALNIMKEIQDKEGIASSYNSIGLTYENIGNYPEALNNHIASLKINEEIKNKKGIASSYNNIGNVYWAQQNYPEALKNHLASLKIKEELGNKRGISISYNNIGNIYSAQGNYTEALKSYFAAMKVNEEIGRKDGIAMSYNNIGGVYEEQGKYPDALLNYFASLKINQEIGNKKGLSLSYYNIASIYSKQNRFGDAFSYFNQSLSLAKEIGSLEDIKYAYEGLAKLDSAEGNYKQALEHFKLYITFRDSLFNEENTKKLVQTQMQYEFDKKESLAKVEQEKKDAIAAKELQKQKFLRNGFVGGFAVVLLFAGVFFTQRNRIKKGKKRSDELLLNILPQEVAEELKQKGSTEAKQFDDVTVMFTDFKDFTRLSEKLSPAELVTQIDYCYKAFDGIMGKYNIEKIKTIGDSYMAAGGLPVRNKTNATDVVKAALEIQRFIEEDAQQKRSEGKEIIEIRIGVHSGPVVAGIVGIKKFAYDIWGDTVNIASRMERSSEPGKVNISGSTYELVKDKFKCIYRGKIQAKNKGEIDMYFVEHQSVK